MDAIGSGDLSKVKLAPKDQALLKFVKLLTEAPAHTVDDDVQAMRTAGWTDEQIWEAALEASMFAMLNRMADAHGLDYPASGWYPPELRAKMLREAPQQPESAGTPDKK